MKKTILIAATFVFITGCLLIAQDGNAGETMSLKDTVPPAKTYVLNERKYFALSFKDSLSPAITDTLTLWQKFKAASEQRIDSNDRRIAELKTNMADKEDKVKNSHGKTITGLEQRNETLKKSLGDYKEDEKENLESFKQRFNKDINEITKAIRGIKFN